MRSDPSHTSVIAAKIRAAQAYRTDEYASGWKPWSRMYFETVKLSAHRLTVASSIRSAGGRRPKAPPTRRLISLERGRGGPSESRLLLGAPAHRLLAAACRLCRLDHRFPGRLARIGWRPGV